MNFIKWIFGLIVFSLLYLLLIYFLEQPILEELCTLIYLVLLVFIPIGIFLTLLLLLLLKRGKGLIYYIAVAISLLLISNISLLWVMDIGVGRKNQYGLLFETLAVWDTSILFIVLVLIRAMLGHFYKKSHKTVLFDIKEEKRKIFKVMAVGILLFVWFSQLFLLSSAIKANQAVQLLDIKDKSSYSISYFYRPFVSRIDLKNGLRWSYHRMKFVDD